MTARPGETARNDALVIPPAVALPLTGASAVPATCGDRHGLEAVPRSSTRTRSPTRTQ